MALLDSVPRLHQLGINLVALDVWFEDAKSCRSDVAGSFKLGRPPSWNFSPRTQRPVRIAIRHAAFSGTQAYLQEVPGHSSKLADHRTADPLLHQLAEPGRSKHDRRGAEGFGVPAV